MKNFRTAIAALIIAGGTIGAFAFTKADKTENKAKVLITYYAIEDSPGSTTYHWGTAIPTNFTCVMGPAVCSVNADSKPEDNKLPEGVKPANRLFRAP